jgi:hypothetical protein
LEWFINFSNLRHTYAQFFLLTLQYCIDQLWEKLIIADNIHYYTLYIISYFTYYIHKMNYHMRFESVLLLDRLVLKRFCFLHCRVQSRVKSRRDLRIENVAGSFLGQIVSEAHEVAFLKKNNKNEEQ